MTKQEKLLNKSIKEEMSKLRNASVATGMRSAMSVVLNMCNKPELTDKEKIEKIREFCERGLNNGK